MKINSLRISAAAMALATGLALGGGTAMASGGGGPASGGGAAACSEISTFAVRAGYRPRSYGRMGAIWTTVKLGSCPTSPPNLGYHLNEYDMATGVLMGTGEGRGINFSYTWDNDNVPLRSTYRIELVVFDVDSGRTVTTANKVASTPTI